MSDASRKGRPALLAMVAGAALLWAAAPALAHEDEMDDGHVVPHTFEGYPGIDLEGGVTWFFQETDGSAAGDTGALTYTFDFVLARRVSDTGVVVVALEGGDGLGVDDRLGPLSATNYDAFYTQLTSNVEGATNITAPSISQIYYEGDYYDGALTVDFGKLDVHSMFDDNAFANDETDQFLSAMFTRSADTSYRQLDFYYAPGLAIKVVPVDLAEVTLIAANGNSDGFDSVTDRPYLVGQLNLKPSPAGLDGNYRFYGLYDARRGQTEIATGRMTENVAWGVSFDQALPGGFGVFARYSAQDDGIDQNAVKASWSAGAVVSGDAWSRADDVLGVGYGVALVNEAAADIAAIAAPGDEGHLEAYYKLGVSDHLTVTPDLQVITNIGGDDTADTVTVAGVRAQLNF